MTETIIVLSSEAQAQFKRRRFVNDDPLWEATSSWPEVKKRKLVFGHWNRLGTDVWIYIFTFLDMKNHFEFEQCSKKYREMGQKPQSWCPTIDFRKFLDINPIWLRRFIGAPIKKLILSEMCESTWDVPENSTIMNQFLSSLTSLVHFSVTFPLPLSEDQWKGCTQSWPGIDYLCLR